MATASLKGVRAAAELLHGRVVKTPVLESRLLNEELGGGRLLLKAESLQHTGSFKYRGALHRLICLQRDDPAAAARGTVAFSSGNFGQALAAASTSLGLKCTIVSPHDAPPVKLERIRQYGADLRTSTADYSAGENREVVASAMAQELSRRHGMTLLHPFDDVDVIHGQGTVGVEFLSQARDILGGGGLELIASPCGGGGMAAGVGLAAENSETKVMTVEPPGYDDHAHSFASPTKERLALASIYRAGDGHGKSTACDALMAGAPGVVTWEVNRRLLSGALVVSSDASVARAMRVAFDHFRLVLEPSAALPLAAVLDGMLSPQCGEEARIPPGRTIGIIASGGNTDLSTFARLMGCTAGA
jgi:threonine dehydratase